MSRILQLGLNDFRNIVREQILWVMFFFAPLLQFLLARLLVPRLEDAFPALADFRLVILMLMALQVVSGIGFVVASIMLDEKDEGVLTAIRTLPLGADTFLISRLLGAVLIAFVFSLAMLGGTGLVALPGPALPTAALLFALLTPTVALVLAGFARNKVEGLAIFKVLNLVLLLPVVSLFLSGVARYALSVIPVYWTYLFVDRASSGAGAAFYGLVALTFHSAVLIGLYHWFKRKVF
jgi:hypothetical protein